MDLGGTDCGPNSGNESMWGNKKFVRRLHISHWQGVSSLSLPQMGYVPERERKRFIFAPHEGNRLLQPLITAINYLGA
jgi:hypothetical protein